MTSALRGKRTSAVQVTNVSPHGFWLLLDERELFVAFTEFPWFHGATIRQLTDVERPVSHHLRWPSLDVDLSIESIEHPDRFPLVSRVKTQAAKSGKRLTPKPGPSPRARIRG
jgi:hypothetical protein